MTVTREASRGTFANGMPYLRWGSGVKSLLFLQGGPGSAPPSPREFRLMGRMFRPYVDAGYAVWIVSRRRHMRAGYTVSDMADDFAEVIRDELGGRVDVVYGLSYGGIIAQYLAAGHPDRAGRVVLVGAACEVSRLSVGSRQGAGRPDRGGAGVRRVLRPGASTPVAAPAAGATAGTQHDGRGSPSGGPDRGGTG